MKYIKKLLPYWQNELPPKSDMYPVFIAKFSFEFKKKIVLAFMANMCI